MNKQKYKDKYYKSIESYGAHTSYFRYDNQDMKSIRTNDGQYISYYTVPIDTLQEDEFTINVMKPQPDKILKIDNTETFDIFTNKYGNIENQQDYIFIKWNQVAHDYKGFYINKDNVGLYLSKHAFTNYKKWILKSWWSYEYDSFDILSGKAMIFSRYKTKI